MKNENKMFLNMDQYYDLSGPCIVCKKRKKMLKAVSKDMGPFCGIKCRKKAVEALKQEHYGE